MDDEWMDEYLEDVLGSLNATRQEARSSSASQNKSLLETDEPYHANKLDLNSTDFTYHDPVTSISKKKYNFKVIQVGPGPQRPKTGLNEAVDPFDMRDILADELLPE